MLAQSLLSRFGTRALFEIKFEPIKLPFGKAELEPYLTKENVELHYEKHHWGYAKTLDQLMTTTAKNLQKYETLEDLIKSEKGKPYNLSAQILNHDLYFANLKKNESGELPKPEGKLMEEIEKAFGSFDAFKKQMTDIATAHFGSGWAWLVFNQKKGKLEIIDTHDAESPISRGLYPLLTIDVWEHAYYPSYKNLRPDYLEKIWFIINWEAVAARFEKC